MSPLRVVLDTNVLVSALLFDNGSMTWLRSAWLSGGVKPLASRETASELLRVMAYPKFRLSEQDREELLAEYLPWCETVVVPDPPPLVPECRDADDRPFLLLAASGHADALVTGDRDLLDLSTRFPVPIVAPADLKQRLSL